MDVFTAVGGFFTGLGAWLASIGLTAADTLTGVLAVVAIFMSGAALRQNSKFQPRPKIKFEWAGEKYVYNGVMVTVCRIINVGTGAARDMRVTVKGSGIVCKLPDWDQWDKFDEAQRYGFEVPLEPAVRYWSSPGTGRDRDVYEPSSMGVTVAPKHKLKPGEYLRPVVEVRYRGRRRALKSTAPNASTLTSMGPSRKI